MKELGSIIAFFLLVISLQAQDPNPKFVKAMEKALAGMDTLKTAEQWLGFSNSFERIALKEPKEWLPAYYVALGQTLAFNMTKDNSMYELMAKRAEEFINKADALNPDNSEIYVLKSMISGLFIRINPMVNGQKYAPVAAAQLEKALKFDPENPRAYMQKGMTLFFTPEQWGGDKKAGIELMEKAAAKYDVFKPATSIAPAWGKEMNAYILEMANK
jgi:hypothetical protein